MRSVNKEPLKSNIKLKAHNNTEMKEHREVDDLCDSYLINMSKYYNNLKNGILREIKTFRN